METDVAVLRDTKHCATYFVVVILHRDLTYDGYLKKYLKDLFLGLLLQNKYNFFSRYKYKFLLHLLPIARLT